MNHLKLVTGTKPPKQRPQALANLITGRCYIIDGNHSSGLIASHGIVSDYQVSSAQGKAVPLTIPSGHNSLQSCFLWDTDLDRKNLDISLLDEENQQTLVLADCAVKNNALEIDNHSLQGPELLTVDGVTRLTLSLQADYQFSSDSFAAQLGMIHLVEATRFIRLEDGREISLLNTHDNEAPVLVVEHPTDEQAVKLLHDTQDLGNKQTYSYHYSIGQDIPEYIDGIEVESVTVLEQYLSYFMQRAIPFDDRQNIWTPIHAPLLWGWSIRVGRRGDEEWGILKRKLILPTAGNDGFQLPEWEYNTAHCSEPIS